jgi:hypothetical protein
MPRPRAIAAALLLAPLALLAACSPTIWERTFQPDPSATIALNPDGTLQPLPAAEQPRDVLIREIPWERLDAVRADLRRDVASSDTHPDDWTPERRAAAHAALLKGLQITADPATITVLGLSEFRTTDTVRPPTTDGSLAAFARRLGATRVVWASRYLGKADRVTHEPVTVFRDNHDWYWDGNERRYRPSAFPDRTTATIPLVIQTDESAWAAYFLSDNSPR